MMAPVKKGRKTFLWLAVGAVRIWQQADSVEMQMWCVTDKNLPKASKWLQPADIPVRFFFFFLSSLWRDLIACHCSPPQERGEVSLR